MFNLEQALKDIQPLLDNLFAYNNIEKQEVTNETELS